MAHIYPIVKEILPELEEMSSYLNRSVVRPIANGSRIINAPLGNGSTLFIQQTVKKAISQSNRAAASNH
jgi:hypothetical protein